MKQKILTFLVGFLTYGLLFGAVMYYLENNKNLSMSIKSGIAFGFFMSLFELFILPKVKIFFKKKNNP